MGLSFADEVTGRSLPDGRKYNKALPIPSPDRVYVGGRVHSDARERLLGAVPDPDVFFLIAHTDSHTHAIRRDPRVLVRAGGCRYWFFASLSFVRPMQARGFDYTRSMTAWKELWWFLTSDQMGDAWCSVQIENAAHRDVRRAV